MEKYLIYPINRPQTFLEKIICNLSKWPIFCPVCGNISYISNINKQNLRETCLCNICHSTNRQRQIAFTLCQHLKISSLKEIEFIKKKVIIYNTESSGPVHNRLIKYPYYIYSEYFGEQYKSGEKVNGILNEDLNKLSFNDDTIDIVISSDVFEHIPSPYKAHKEVYRVLKKDGYHIFSVPFYQNQYLDETRAIVSKKEVTKYFKKPIYHDDGVRPEKGILVFTIFSLEMLSKLFALGFYTNMYVLNKPCYGILGSNAIIFKSIK